MEKYKKEIKCTTNFIILWLTSSVYMFYKWNLAIHFRFILVFYILSYSDYYFMLLCTLKTRWKMNSYLKMGDLSSFMNYIHMWHFKHFCAWRVIYKECKEGNQGEFIYLEWIVSWRSKGGERLVLRIWEEGVLLNQ